jgi:hypothetical protein
MQKADVLYAKNATKKTSCKFAKARKAKLLQESNNYEIKSF